MSTVSTGSPVSTASISIAKGKAPIPHIAYGNYDDPDSPGTDVAKPMKVRNCQFLCGVDVERADQGIFVSLADTLATRPLDFFPFTWLQSN